MGSGGSTVEIARQLSTDEIEFGSSLVRPNTRLGLKPSFMIYGL